MARVLMTGLIVIGLIALRLLMPPSPRVFQSASQRWGRRTVMFLGALGLGCAAVAILVMRR